MSSEVFADELLKRSLSSLCSATGFKMADSLALQMLVKVCKDKVKGISTELTCLGETAGRKQVLVEDFAHVVTERHRTTALEQALSRFSNQDTVHFPVEGLSLERKRADGDVNVPELQSGIEHLPRYPPAHTYKRSKQVELVDMPASTVNELKRIQQRHSSLVRESLARMQQSLNTTVSRETETHEH